MSKDSVFYFTEGVLFFVTIFLAIVLLVGLAYRWAQNYQLSRGHFISGGIGVSCMFIFALVMAVDIRFSLLFVPVMLLGLIIWVGYSNWYYYKYPIPPNFVQSLPAPATFGLNTRLGQFLTAKTAERPNLFGVVGQLVGVGLLVLVMGIFGFVRWADAIAYGDKRVVAVTNNAKKETAVVVKSAVATAVTSATTAVVKEVSTLREEQKEGVKTAKIATEAATKAAQQVQAEGKRRDRNAVKRFNSLMQNIDRNRQIIQAPTNRIEPKTGSFRLPTNIKAPEPVKKGRKTSYEEGEDEERETAETVLVRLPD